MVIIFGKALRDLTRRRTAKPQLWVAQNHDALCRLGFLGGGPGPGFFSLAAAEAAQESVRSSRGCSVLESVNPDPATNGYSRVMSWIDSESLGPLHAEAYDVKGKL